MASGKTLAMRAIRRPAPTYIHRHVGAPRWVRRNRKAFGLWRGSYVQNVPYVSADRQRKKGRAE